MDSKLRFLVSLTLCTGALTLGVVALGNGNKFTPAIFHGENEISSLTLGGSPVEIMEEGTGSFYSAKGVKFAYTGAVAPEDGAWLRLSKGGTLGNPYQEGIAVAHNRIAKMSSIQISFTGSLTLDYSWQGDSYARQGFVMATDAEFKFLNESPNFFRLIAGADTSITSIQIKYSCATMAEENLADKTDYLISSIDDLKQFRDAVNLGKNFAGETVKLTQDLDFAGIEMGNSIGNSDEKPFSGTFDGGDHTISNIEKSGNDAVALFSRVTNGTIKNLKLAGFTISTKSQRSAALVARLSDATIDNCHVLSGTITGVKQNGGLVGVIVDGGTIKNSSNSASVFGSGIGNGGILGFLFSGTASIESSENKGSITSTSEGTGGVVGYLSAGELNVTECINTGTVNGKSNGTGGILGASSATSAASPKTVIVRNSTNHARVKGVSYVGGIVGLPRASESSSIIENCKNMGDIEATTGYAGGITGAARISLVNCATAVGVTITSASNSIVVAANSSQIGAVKTTPGAITGTKETGGSLTDCFICDAEGNPLA